MASLVAVMGESGAGKTTSCRNFSPDNTIIIDADKKGLPWRAWRKEYNATAKNYFRTDDAGEVSALAANIAGKAPDIHVLIIDTGNALMVADEYRRRGEKGYDKWQDLAWSIWALVDSSMEMRDDLIIYFLFHAQTERDDSGFLQTRIKTSGRKLDKIVLESKFQTVLLCKTIDGKHIFETQAHDSTAKSPMGMLPEQMPNDLAEVDKKIRDYEGLKSIGYRNNPGDSHGGK